MESIVEAQGYFADVCCNFERGHLRKSASRQDRTSPTRSTRRYAFASRRLRLSTPNPLGVRSRRNHDRSLALLSFFTGKFYRGIGASEDTPEPMIGFGHRPMAVLFLFDVDDRILDLSLVIEHVCQLLRKQEIYRRRVWEDGGQRVAPATEHDSSGTEGLRLTRSAIELNSTRRAQQKRLSPEPIEFCAITSETNFDGIDAIRSLLQQHKIGGVSFERYDGQIDFAYENHKSRR